MPIRFRYVEVGAAIGLVLVFASCDKSPTSPRPVESGPAAVVTTVRIELVAPSEIAPGESVQLIANAVKSNGSVENVSSQSHWTPADSPVVKLSTAGLATGQNVGEQVVSAEFNGRSAKASISVVPKGTFRLGGTVQDSGFGLDNVALTVTSGVGQGLKTLSGSNGSYVFYGVSGSVRIQATKDGYLTSTQEIDVPAHRTYDFNMVPERPRKDYRGVYTLTISASEPCLYQAGTVPDAAKRRVYTANVAQDGGRLTVTLTDADFIVTNGYGNRFFGFVDSTDAFTFPIGVAFDFYYYYDGHLDIVERFSTTALVINGTVSARGTPALISGTLRGSILIAGRATPPFFATFNSRCYNAAHGFEMVRR